MKVMFYADIMQQKGMVSDSCLTLDDSQNPLLGTIRDVTTRIR